LPAGGFFAHRLKDEGIDVVVGLLETHGWGEIAKLAEGLEIVPRRRQEYHGLIVEKMFFDLEVPNEFGLSKLS
jgi:two-component system sensor histidine kinase KdpD